MVDTLLAGIKTSFPWESSSVHPQKRNSELLGGVLQRQNLHFHITTERNPICLQSGRAGRLRVSAILHDAERYEPANVPLVKVCGVTNVRDAIMAAEAGAKYVGMILWPKSKRSVSVDAAKAIAHAVRMHQSEPVGVFVDENAATIEKCCNAADIHIAQLHGEGARSSCWDLPSHLKRIYVLHVDKKGAIQTKLPISSSVDWILLDSVQGGSGHTFDWKEFKAPAPTSKHGWFLAGGLNPDNVASAISILKPSGVDVSSGVTQPDGILKDHARISAFINAVKSCHTFMEREKGHII